MQEQSEAAVDGVEFGVVAPEEGVEDGALVGEKVKAALFAVTTGELRDMKRRNSEYAVGGLMGVLAISSLPGKVALLGIAGKERAEIGVRAELERADNSEGKLAVTGVVTASLGLFPGMMEVVVLDGV